MTIASHVTELTAVSCINYPHIFSPSFIMLQKNFIWTSHNIIKSQFKASMIILFQIFWSPRGIQEFVVCYYLDKKHLTTSSHLNFLLFKFLSSKINILINNICKLLLNSVVDLKSLLSLLYLKTMFRLYFLWIYISNPQPASNCIPYFIMWTVQT